MLDQKQGYKQTTQFSPLLCGGISSSIYIVYSHFSVYRQKFIIELIRVYRGFEPTTHPYITSTWLSRLSFQKSLFTTATWPKTPHPSLKTVWYVIFFPYWIYSETMKTWTEISFTSSTNWRRLIMQFGALIDLILSITHILVYIQSNFRLGNIFW